MVISFITLIAAQTYEKDDLGFSEMACRRIDNILDHLPDASSSSSSASTDEQAPAVEDPKVEEALRLIAYALKWGQR